MISPSDYKFFENKNWYKSVNDDLVDRYSPVYVLVKGAPEEAVESYREFLADLVTDDCDSTEQRDACMKALLPFVENPFLDKK